MSYVHPQFKRVLCLLQQAKSAMEQLPKDMMDFGLAKKPGKYIEQYQELSSLIFQFEDKSGVKAAEIRDEQVLGLAKEINTEYDRACQTGDNEREYLRLVRKVMELGGASPSYLADLDGKKYFGDHGDRFLVVPEK